MNNFGIKSQYSYNELVSLTSSNVPFEIGGVCVINKDLGRSCDDALKNEELFTVDTKSKVGMEGRKYVELGTVRGNTYFHTHPKMDGFWPSKEDLLRCVKNGTQEYIFTLYGVWYMKCNTSNLNDIQTVLKHRLILDTHLVMLTQKAHWTLEEMNRHLEIFKGICKLKNFEVSFHPINLYKQWMNDRHTTKFSISNEELIEIM